MFYGKLLGLISDLALPDAQAILGFTKQSSEPEKAFRRYVSTILHMRTWYSYGLEPGSKIWGSLMRIRGYHNMASKMCRTKGIGEITQCQMALAQFGFMGYILIRPKAVGIHKFEEEDLEGFVHFWRVIGHLLGIEERYNICRNSLSDTKIICEEIIKQVFRPEILKWDPNFLSMTEALTSGMWCMMPVLNKNVLLRFIYELIRDQEDNEPKFTNPIKLSFTEGLVWYTVYITLFFLKFDIIRVFQRYHMHLILYFTENFPFLAYFKFRKINFNIRPYSEQKVVNYVN